MYSRRARTRSNHPNMTSELNKAAEAAVAASTAAARAKYYRQQNRRSERDGRSFARAMLAGFGGLDDDVERSRV